MTDKCDINDFFSDIAPASIKPEVFKHLSCHLTLTRN